MGNNSKIEWTTHTFNPWLGCTKVSDGCKFCYAEEMMDHRYGRVQWGKGKPRQRTSEANWKLPLKWNREAEAAGEQWRVFCASLADVFDEEVPDEWRVDLFRLIFQTPHLDWQLLTKRPQNIIPALQNAQKVAWEQSAMGNYGLVARLIEWEQRNKPPSNVWLGVSVENQEAADKRREHFKAVPAAVKFVSYEPAVGPVNWTGWEFVNQIISGGESGPKARPSHPNWHRNTRIWCATHGIRYFFKQWGQWLPADQTSSDDPRRRVPGRVYMTYQGALSPSQEPAPCSSYLMLPVGKKAAGRLLDGRTWDEMPAVAEATR